MKPLLLAVIASLAVLAIPDNVRAQDDDICREFGENPTREFDRQGRPARFIYGRVILKGLTSTAKWPRVTVIYTDLSQPATRQNIGKSGNYCFKRAGNAGLLVIDVDGVETARKALSDLGIPRQREDFEVYASPATDISAPGVVSTKFSRPPNENTRDLYRKVAESERDRNPKAAVDHAKLIVSVDPTDFIAWAKLGSLYLDLNALTDAEAAFRKSIEARTDYTPALLNLGILRALQKQYPEAIELFKQAVASDATSARAHRLLGEAYLQNRWGSLGLAALDEALKLDPIGMAECHLLKARLYDLVGAKNLAAAEYREFLRKVSDHPDRKKLEKYIKENP